MASRNLRKVKNWIKGGKPNKKGLRLSETNPINYEKATKVVVKQKPKLKSPPTSPLLMPAGGNNESVPMSEEITNETESREG